MEVLRLPVFYKGHVCAFVCVVKCHSFYSSKTYLVKVSSPSGKSVVSSHTFEFMAKLAAHSLVKEIQKSFFFDMSL